MERICHGFGANHLQKGLDSKPETLAPVGEHWLGWAGLGWRGPGHRGWIQRRGCLPQVRTRGARGEAGFGPFTETWPSQHHGPLSDTQSPPLSPLPPLPPHHPVKRQQESSSPEPSRLGLRVLQDPSWSDQKACGGRREGRVMSEAATPVSLSADAAALLQCWRTPVLFDE